jgi:hypothetical protein
MIYVLAAPQHAEQLSRSIMRLLRPAHLRGEGWTDLYCSVLTHPTSGETALALPEQEMVPIHAEADGAELTSMLSVFVADGALSQAEAAGIVSAVQSNAGKLVRIADFIPPSWSPYLLTPQQMIDGGWFSGSMPPDADAVTE